jgi:hypothetical protein
MKLPAGFRRDQRFRDETAEQNQNGVKQLAMEEVQCNRDQNRVSAHRRSEPLVHSRGSDI